jgi:hypothetical protein
MTGIRLEVDGSSQPIAWIFNAKDSSLAKDAVSALFLSEYQKFNHQGMTA